MATRFYLPSSGTVTVSPSFNVGWEDTTAASRLPAFTYKKSTAMTTVSFLDADKTDKDILFRQYVTPPLVAQTIASQTIKFQIRGAENHTGNNMFTALHIRVVNNGGTADIGTILALTRDATEVVLTTLTNRLFSATSTSLVVSEGDRLVFEVGTGGDPAATSNGHDSDLRIGDVAASDLAEDDTSTADNNPWIEFVTGVTMRFVDYKFSSIQDDGVNTTVKYRVYENNNANPPIRSEVLTTLTKVLNGSQTIAQCRTDLNSNECIKWGIPITAQQ
jgi:hypothetical protein